MQANPSACSRACKLFVTTERYIAVPHLDKLADNISELPIPLRPSTPIVGKGSNLIQTIAIPGFRYQLCVSQQRVLTYHFYESWIPKWSSHR